MNTDYDVVIIGAGVAGALVAWKLAEAECRVLMIDAGEKRLDEGDRKLFVKAFAEAAQNDRTPSRPYVDAENNKFARSPDVADFNLAKSGDNLYYRQAGPDVFKSQYQRLAGGSTWAWRGNSPRFIPSDFELKTRYPTLDKAVDWPIKYTDLETWYGKAEEALGVAGDHEEWSDLFEAYRSQPFPMPKIVQSYGDQKLIEKLRGVTVDGIEVQVIGLPQARNSKPYDGRPACEGNSNCIPLCPIQAKYDATVHVKKALRLGAELIERAVVTDLKLDHNSNVGEVIYKIWGDAQARSAKGKIIVLAAHAIESAKILLMSNERKGVANSSDQVGRNLMDHLGGEGNALMPFAVFPFRGPQSTSCIESFRDGKFRSERCAFRLTIGNDGWGRSEHPFKTLDNLIGRKLFGEALQKELHDIVTHQLRIAYTTEQLPDPDNRVTLSPEEDGFGTPKPLIAFKVDDYSRKGMEYAQKVIEQLFAAVGAQAVECEFSDLKAGFYSGSAHVMGTCRMGYDPKRSVVDAECRSHDHQNLFIVGSSVFPTGSTANPTLTIAALALRTAQAIHRKLR